MSCHDWLRELDARLANRPQIDPTVIFWRGEPYQIAFSPDSFRIPQFQDGAVGVRADDSIEARATLERYLRREAIGMLTERVQHWAAIMDVQPVSLRFGDARQRWGSCNSRGGLNLNWRLAMTPARCLDYVVVHELAHLRHMNHGSAFWAEVERFFPSRREAEAWLKEHAHLILRRA
jgi:predicted metal-dependent hydrolase